MKIFKELNHFFYWLLKTKPSGLILSEPDPRDFKTGVFGWFGYKAKSSIKINKTLSVKDQGDMNTCQWCATATCKEPDEGVELSTRLLVSKGRRMGFITGNGFSKMESGEKILKEWGIPEVIHGINENEPNWEKYSGLDPDLYKDRAAKHKTSTYWSVSNLNDFIKLIDEGHRIKSALMWYTGFNQGGGFRHPWIISKAVGYKVGGHAISGIGYIYGYIGIDSKTKKVIASQNGINVVVMQNSYSEKWGATFIDDKGITHRGCFFVEMNYFDKNNLGMTVNLDDIDKELGRFINDFDGKNVKGSKPTIYFVQKGKLKAYPDETTYLAFNVNDGELKKWYKIDDALLDRVEKGDNMDLKKSLYWDYLKNLNNQERRRKLVEIITGFGKK